MLGSDELLAVTMLLSTDALTSACLTGMMCIVVAHVAYKVLRGVASLTSANYTRVSLWTALFGMRGYVRGIMDFYCKEYCNFKKELTSVEWEYVAFCLAEAPREYRVSATMFLVEQEFSWLYPRWLTLQSHLTFSHRCKNGVVDSSGLALGVPTAREFWKLNKLTKLTKAVLAERKVNIDHYLASGLRCSGLGWMVREEGFKIYLLCDDWRQIHRDFKRLADMEPPTLLAKYKSAALVSLTYKRNKLVEHKLYLYAAEEQVSGKTGSVGHYEDVLMLSTSRKHVKQSAFCGPDPENPLRPLRFRMIKECLNDEGQRLAWKNEAHGYTFDTYSGDPKDRDNWTIYFPF